MEYLPGIVLFRLKYVIPFNFPNNLMWKVLTVSIFQSMKFELRDVH